MPKVNEIKPISERKPKLDQKDFFVSIPDLQEYFHSLEFLEPGMKFLESDKIAQLTPLGLAVVADCYNHKGDQHCKILIACSTEELVDIIKQVYHATAAKLVVIFQPTDGTDEIFFPSFHKTVVYLEKRLDQFHCMHADCVHAKEIEGYMEKLVGGALPNCAFTFYKQEPMLLDSDGSWLHLLAGYTQCGTHALRIARKLAQSEDVIGKLRIVTQDNSSPNNIKIATYMLPPFLAVNADSSVTRTKLLTMYSQGKDYQDLTTHFSKYTKYEYAGKFSRKYIGVVDAILQSSTDADLNERIDRADARKFKLKS